MMLLAHLALTSAWLMPSPGRVSHVTPRTRALAMAAGNEAIDFPEMDGSTVRVGIIKARWHEDVCNNLVDGIKSSLKTCGVNDENVIESEVPGSFELPLAARYLALSGTVDVIIPIGVLIKGDTYHFEVIADTVTRGLMDVSLSTGIPVLMGVLTVNDEQQATYRSTGSNNHGSQWGMAAVEMALLRRSAVGRKGRSFLGFGGEGDESSKPKQDIGKIGF